MGSCAVCPCMLRLAFRKEFAVGYKEARHKNYVYKISQESGFKNNQDKIKIRMHIGRGRGWGAQTTAELQCGFQSLPCGVKRDGQQLSPAGGSRPRSCGSFQVRGPAFASSQGGPPTLPSWLRFPGPAPGSFSAASLSEAAGATEPARLPLLPAPPRPGTGRPSPACLSTCLSTCPLLHPAPNTPVVGRGGGGLGSRARGGALAAPPSWGTALPPSPLPARLLSAFPSSRRSPPRITLIA